jgi:CHAT domain-containing protein
MAGALWGLGRRQDSLDCLERQLEVVRADGDRYQEASALFSLSVLVSRVSDTSTRSNALLQEALAAAMESGNAPVEASVRIGMAEDAESASPAWRIGQLERALAILRRTREVANTCFALRELARWLVEVPGGVPRALAAAEEAVQRAREAGDRFHLTRGMVRRWSLAADYAPRATALNLGFESLDAVEAIRGLQRDEDARARVLADWVFVYQEVIGYLLTQPAGATAASAADVERAFQVAERLRAQELLAALDMARSASLLGRTRPEHAARQAVLDQIARTQQSLLDVGLAPPARRELLSRLETLEVKERALRDRMASADDVAAALSPRLATTAEAQQALAPDQALLAFALGQRPPALALSVERPWLFVLTRDSVRTVRLPDDAVNPRRLVAAFAGLVARRDGAEGEGAARLYRLLLQEGLARLPATVKRLVVVPDGALHRVPFDALRESPDAPPLATRYEVTVVPSASLWLRLRGRPQPAHAALLALADPRWAGSEGVAIERQAALWQGLALGALPRGRREARVALRALGGEGRLLAGVAATERALKTADLGRYALLHVAAHAVVDDQNGERSAIVLAPGAPDEDGLLQAREIVGLDLSGLVVVLSACGSSSGEVLAGEGPLSLARAFLQAGARAVVGNLWEVRDDEAELLMSAFYRELGAGATVAAALAAARRERIAAGAPAAAWAGTVVLGNGAATLTTAGRRAEWRAARWAGAGLLAVGLAAPFAFWWRRRRSARR